MKNLGWLVLNLVASVVIVLAVVFIYQVARSEIIFNIFMSPGIVISEIVPRAWVYGGENPTSEDGEVAVWFFVGVTAFLFWWTAIFVTLQFFVWRVHRHLAREDVEHA